MHPSRLEEILDAYEHRIATLEEIVRKGQPKPRHAIHHNDHEAIYQSRAAPILRIVRAFDGLHRRDLHLRFMAETQMPLSSRQFDRWLHEMAAREEIRLEIRFGGKRGSESLVYLGKRATSDLNPQPLGGRVP